MFRGIKCMELIVNFFFAVNLLFLVFIWDWDKYIAAWQTCFIWGSDLRLKSSCIRLTTVLCSDSLLILYHLHTCNLGTFRSRIVETGKHFSSEFKVNKVLRQGDAIARLLFNIVLEIAIIRSNLETWGTIFDKCGQIMAYADDDIMGEDYKMLKQYLHHWSNKQIRWVVFFYQLGAQILYFNTFITFLYMFQVLLCSSSGGQLY